MQSLVAKAGGRYTAIRLQERLRRRTRVDRLRRDHDLERHVCGIEHRAVGRAGRSRQERIAIGQSAPFPEPLRPEVHEIACVVRRPHQSRHDVADQQNGSQCCQGSKREVWLPLPTAGSDRAPHRTRHQAQRDGHDRAKNEIDQRAVGRTIEQLNQVDAVEEQHSWREQQHEFVVVRVARAHKVDRDGEREHECEPKCPGLGGHDPLQELLTPR